MLIPLIPSAEAMQAATMKTLALQDTCMSVTHVQLISVSFHEALVKTVMKAFNTHAVYDLCQVTLP